MIRKLRQESSRHDDSFAGLDGSVDFVDEVFVTSSLSRQKEHFGFGGELRRGHKGHTQHADKIHDIEVAAGIAVRWFVAEGSGDRMLAHLFRQIRQLAELPAQHMMSAMPLHQIPITEENDLLGASQHALVGLLNEIVGFTIAVIEPGAASLFPGYRAEPTEVHKAFIRLHKAIALSSCPARFRAHPNLVEQLRLTYHVVAEQMKAVVPLRVLDDDGSIRIRGFDGIDKKLFGQPGQQVSPILRPTLLAFGLFRFLTGIRGAEKVIHDEFIVDFGYHPHDSQQILLRFGILPIKPFQLGLLSHAEIIPGDGGNTAGHINSVLLEISLHLLKERLLDH